MLENIKKALHHSTSFLQETSPSARLDAEILISHVLGKSRTFLHTHPETELDDFQRKKLQELLDKRLSGTPIAYLTGTRDFWSLTLNVNENTLIPRPETELLVEIILSTLKDKKSASILDLGTGSGAIALSIAKEHKDWHITATDKSSGALKVAKMNAQNLGIKNISFIESDWFTNIPAQKFDAIVSNPPYIATNDPHMRNKELEFEPVTALVSGMDGMDDLNIIIDKSMAFLKPGGILVLEHGFDQRELVLNQFKLHDYHNVLSFKDWQGNDRVCAGVA